MYVPHSYHTKTEQSETAQFVFLGPLSLRQAEISLSYLRLHFLFTRAQKSSFLQRSRNGRSDFTRHIQKLSPSLKRNHCYTGMYLKVLMKHLKMEL